ncbi:MAG: type II toxin-antitoxin system VapC family toxin [Candidatus Binatia bacterium]
MVFLDSNLFIIDRFFRRDALFPATRRFLEKLPDMPGALPLMTLLEICGAASFRLSPAESERWLHDFTAVYPLRVLNPFGSGDGNATDWLASWSDDLTRYIARRMSFGDAVLAREADRYAAEVLVTWNRRDFEGRTAVPVVTPDQFLNDA